MRSRITTAIIAVVVATLVATGLITFVLNRRSDRANALDELRRQAPQVAALAAADSSRADLLPTDVDCTAFRNPTRRKACETAQSRNAGREELRSALALEGIAILGFTADGTPTPTNPELPSPLRPRDLDLDRVRSGVVSGERDGRLFAMAAQPAARGQALWVAVLTRRMDPAFGATFWSFLIAAIAAIGLGAIVAWRLGARLARPVHDATAVTASIASGNLGARLAEPADDARDEMSVLARSINSMAAGLERSRGLERQFLMSVSHDLRTPLTSIRGYAEAIADGATDQPERAAGVILSESRRLDRLVRDLLDLAHLDARTFTLHPVAADLVDVVSGTVAGFAPELVAAGVQVTETHVDSAPVTADVDRVAQVVANLMQNAVRYARSRVTVTTRTESPGGPERTTTGWACVDVGDDGPGISAEDLPHVFERLYRVAHQPEHAETGGGLGLAIVRELVAAMGGKVGVRSSPGRGSVFTVWLPLASEPASPPPPPGPATASAAPAPGARSPEPGDPPS